MSFTYFIKPNLPNSTHPFSAGATLQDFVEEDEFLAYIATDSGVAQADVEKVLKSLFNGLANFLRETRPIASILGLFRAKPAVGGSYDTADPDANLIRDNCDYHFTPTPAVKAAFRQGLSVQKTGEVGPAIPTVSSVIAMPGGQVNSYQAGGVLEARGSRFHSDSLGAPMPTAVLMNPDGSSPVNLTVFDASDRRVMMQVPASGLLGPKVLEITQDGKSGRSVTLTQL